MKNKIIDVKGLTKKYGNKGTLALDNIDLKIEIEKDVFANGTLYSENLNWLDTVDNLTIYIQEKIMRRSVLRGNFVFTEVQISSSKTLLP